MNAEIDRTNPFRVCTGSHGVVLRRPTTQYERVSQAMVETGSSRGGHEQVIADYVDLWQGDFTKLDVLAESIDLYDPGVPGGELHGRDAFESFLRELRAGFPDFAVHVEDVLAGDGVVMWESTVTGTHEGEFYGIPPTGREMTVIGMSKTLIADGRVQEDRIYYDSREMSEQLGHTEG
jgi:steroid delta-isomerase-like uncharacterized protein